MTWASVRAAVATLLTGDGYTVATVTDAGELPTHTAGSAVIVAVREESDAHTSPSTFDRITIALTAICVDAVDLGAAEQAALTLGQALRTLIEGDATVLPGVGAVTVHEATDISRLGGANAIAITARFNAFQTG